MPPLGSALSPVEIRALRGERSRAAFAVEVGVTAQTVYRWELPETAQESRRPRARERARLIELSRRASGAPADDLLLDPDGARALPAFERILHGDWRRGEAELSLLFAEQREPTPSAAALAAVGLALVQMSQKGSARGALLALSPALRAESEHRLPRRVAVFVHASAALLYSMPDAQIFDPVRVYDRAMRVEEACASRPEPDAECLVAIALMQAALVVGDQAHVSSAVARGELIAEEALSPLLALHHAELRGISAVISGQVSLAGSRFTELVTRAREFGAPLMQARALAQLALRKVDELAPPEEAIALALEAEAVVRAARLPPLVHSVLTARVLVESYLRLGRFEEAEAAMGLAEAYSVETGLPPNAAVGGMARYFFLRRDVAGMKRLLGKLEVWEVPSIRPLVQAYRSYCEALVALLEAAAPHTILEAFARAETESARWPFFHRDVLVFRTSALVATGNLEEARLSLRHMARLLDLFPSPWGAAHALRIEGMLTCFAGDWPHGRKLLEAAISTFDVALDMPDALLVKYTRAKFACVYEEPWGPAEFEALTAELERTGIRPPTLAKIGETSLRHKVARQQNDPTEPIHATALVAPLRRLAVRGANPSVILRELFLVTKTIVPGKVVRLEEVDSNGAELALHADPSLLSAMEFRWIEFGDGMGSRYRLGVAAPLDQGQVSALSVLTVSAAMALEVAGLRGLGHTNDAARVDEKGLEIAGFIAASKSMRAVRSEILRLADSRATIIISGESGTGKEVVARAIHDTSTRSDKPYVAFNCAAVPRDLFEGQLFGYKRGAFTGATHDHPGVIRAAAGGTLFLDEVAELPIDLQPKLLRFLENGEVFPLGDRAASKVDVRIISASHRDLAEMVRRGTFREDLYYRLQVVPIRLPPLRERREDVIVLAKHFLRLLSPEGQVPALASDAIDELTAYAWPGNVRELRNVLERTLAFSPVPDVIRREHLRLK
ncbi:MAG: sigma-54 dependent transcriptional regulator [Polyangiaceae bacterium]